MSYIPKIETVRQVYGENGDYHYEVAQDPDALGLVEVRYIEPARTVPMSIRISSNPAEARLIAQCMNLLADELEAK